MGPGSQNRGFSLANALRADVWNRLCLESATSPQQPKGWRGQPHRAGLVPPCQGTPGSLAPWGRPCHLGGVPGTSGGSLAPRGGPWQPWCRTLCDAHGAQPHYVSCSHPHWLLVPGGQDDAASSINPSRAPGVAQRDLGGAERRPQRCLCSRGGDFWAWGVVVEELGTSSRGQIQIESCIKCFAVPRGLEQAVCSRQKEGEAF